MIYSDLVKMLEDDVAAGDIKQAMRTMRMAYCQGAIDFSTHTAPQPQSAPTINTIGSRLTEQPYAVQTMHSEVEQVCK